MFKIFSLAGGNFFLRSNDLIEPLINTTRLQCPPMTSVRGTISHSLTLNNFETKTKVAFVRRWPFWPSCVMLTLHSIQCKYLSFFVCCLPIHVKLPFKAVCSGRTPQPSHAQPGFLITTVCCWEAKAPIRVMMWTVAKEREKERWWWWWWWWCWGGEETPGQETQRHVDKARDRKKERARESEREREREG